MNRPESHQPLPSGARTLVIVTALYTVLVILWGAVVRITGSGAGCGQHWPTCHGDVVPLAPSFETMIEFSHRVTSGICLPLVIAMVIVVFRASITGHPVRRAALASLFFIITEALIGAGIVLLEYVAENASYYRAAWMALHLVNTFMLMGAIGLTGWHTVSPAPIRLRPWGGLATFGWVLVGGMLLASMTGAVSALGQTLFPALPEQTIVQHVTEDPYANTPYPMLLRLVHPVLAMGLAMALWNFAGRVFDASQGRTRRLAIGLAIGVGVQVAAGFINVALSAPAWMQLVHLGLANAVWLQLVLTLASMGTEAPSRRDTGARVDSGATAVLS